MSACKSLDVLLGRFWQHCVYSTDRNLPHVCINHIDGQNCTQKWLLLKIKLVKMNNFVSCNSVCIHHVLKTGVSYKEKAYRFYKELKILVDFCFVSNIHYIENKNRIKVMHLSVTAFLNGTHTQDVNILDLLFGPHTIDHN